MYLHFKGEVIVNLYQYVCRLSLYWHV